MKWKNDRPKADQGNRKAGIRIRRILLTLAAIVLLCAAAVFAVYRIGLHSLKKQAVTGTMREADEAQGTNEDAAPYTDVDSYTDADPYADADSYTDAYSYPDNMTDVENGRILGDEVIYRGQEYHRNEDIYVILCMGLDTEDDMVAAGTGMGTGAQSDANFLVVVDAAAKKLRIIAIPRDTMTDIETFYADGKSAGLLTDHLALQYAYGDGGTRSCELMERAVSRLFYDLPIDAYVTFSLNSIESLNGMVGGVTVELQEDFEDFKAGETVTLNNEQAYRYVRWRDCGEAYSAQNRLGRQKQYLTAFIEKAIAYTRQDITKPFEIYDSVSDSMLMNLSDMQILSLILLGLQCEFGEDSFYSVPGEQRIGDYYEEYYVDEQEFYEMVLDIFYVSDTA